MCIHKAELKTSFAQKQWVLQSVGAVVKAVKFVTHDENGCVNVDVLNDCAKHCGIAHSKLASLT